MTSTRSRLSVITLVSIAVALMIAFSAIQLSGSAYAQVEPLATSLPFRTPVGAVSIPVGQSRNLGSVDVSTFRQIRVFADERVGSATNVRIRLTLTEGNELVGQLDTLTLSPQSQVTRVYDVPGRRLTIFADALGTGAGSNAVDVLIWGNN